MTYPSDKHELCTSKKGYISEGTRKPEAITNEDLAVTYTDFRKIKTINEGLTNAKQYTITYGVDDQRLRSDYSFNGTTKTRYYLGDYEEETDNLGNVKKFHYLSGGAMMISDNNVETLYYGYTDNQGSLVALTDQNGNVVEKYAYDPWGARRNPTDWRYKDTRSDFITNRGYTGHEHLDMFNIINMNGRVYDPLTAMFFSPDPFLQAPENWLNYNRYGYCMNNPTRYTDPSGYQLDVLDMPKEDGMWDNHAMGGASGISSGLYGVYGALGGFEVGSGVMSGGFTSWNQIGRVASELLNHTDFGGISYGPGQTHYFQNNEQAFNVGYKYLQRFGYNYFAKAIDQSNNNNQQTNLLAKGLKDQSYENNLLWIRYGALQYANNLFGVQLDVRFTGLDDMSNAYWTQWITTNDPGEEGSNFSFDPISGMYSYWDDTHSGNGRYYSNSEMAKHIFGFGQTVTFQDGPARYISTSPNIFWSAQLSLINNGKTVLQINYGFTIDNTGSHPWQYSYNVHP